MMHRRIERAGTRSDDGLDPVIVWQLSERLQSRLELQLGSGIGVVAASSAEHVRKLLEAFPLAALVVQLSERKADVDAVTALARTFPECPIALLQLRGLRSAVQQRHARIAMIAAGIVPVDVGPIAEPEQLESLLEWILGQRTARLPSLVWARVAPLLDDKSATLYRVAIRLAGAPYTIGQLAAVLHCSERSLHRYCRDASIGPPLRLRAISRLLVAAYLIDRGHARIEKVVDVLGFESVDALRVGIKRWSGRSLTELGRRGWLATLQAHLYDTDR